MTFPHATSCSFSPQMALMISLGFLIAWTPYVAVSFWTMFNSQRQGQVAPSVSLLPCLFAKSSTVYNPFIYFFFKRNSWHKPLCFNRQVFSCSRRASLPDEEEKLEVQKVKGSDCCICGSATDKHKVDIMRAPGNQPGAEVLNLG